MTTSTETADSETCAAWHKAGAPCEKPQGHPGRHTAYYGGDDDGGRRPLVSWNRTADDDAT
jgi:hypothetical protein